MGAITSLFKRKDPRTPIKGLLPRLKNILVQHHRGLIGVIVPLCALTWQTRRGRNDLTVMCMWLWMFWFFLWQPVNVPVTGFIPLFFLPMTGTMSSADTCQCYFNESMALFVLAGMLLLLLNNSGVDRRIILWLLCSGDACQFSGKRLIFKASTAAFFMSMFSNRLIVSSTIIQFLTPALMNLQSMTSRYRDTEPDYDEMRYIVLNAVQTASAIGSTAIMHSAYATMAMRMLWNESPPKDKEYPDIFNYLQYSCFAFPVAFITSLINCAYHMLLINWYVNKPMNATSMSEMRGALLKHKNALPPKLSAHEKQSLFFAVFILLMFFFRWCKWLNMGWAGYRVDDASPTVPLIKDATIAAVFLIGLHIVPRTCGFLKFISAETKSQLGPLKPESAILWWRFVDKNTNYGYIILIGSGAALVTSIRESGLGPILAENIGKHLTNVTWNGSIFLVVLITVILANIMSGVAALVVFLPFVLHMATAPFAQVPWPTKVYLGALGVGVGASYGFMIPFLYTPAYFCHYTGKVPIRKMVKYSIGSVIIATIILWLALCYWGPYVWDPNDGGIEWVNAPVTGGASEAPPADAGGGGGGGGGDEGGEAGDRRILL